MIRDNICTWTWFVTIYTHGHDSWRQYIHMDTTHVHMYILSRLRSDDRHSMQWAALESYHSWISFSRSLLPCFSEKRPIRLRSDDTQCSRLYSSHINRGSRSPGLFCHVSVKRDLWDWDQMTLNTVGCTRVMSFLDLVLQVSFATFQWKEPYEIEIEIIWHSKCKRLYLSYIIFMNAS